MPSTRPLEYSFKSIFGVVRIILTEEVVANNENALFADYIKSTSDSKRSSLPSANVDR